MPNDDDENAITLNVAGFDVHKRAAFARIVRLVAAQLDTDLSEVEIMRRLHGWRPREQPSSWPPPEAPL